jgi:hypothetical protein
MDSILATRASIVMFVIEMKCNFVMRIVKKAHTFPLRVCLLALSGGDIVCETRQQVAGELVRLVDCADSPDQDSFSLKFATLFLAELQQAFLRQPLPCVSVQSIYYWNGQACVPGLPAGGGCGPPRSPHQSRSSIRYVSCMCWTLLVQVKVWIRHYSPKHKHTPCGVLFLNNLGSRARV